MTVTSSVTANGKGVVFGRSRNPTTVTSDVTVTDRRQTNMTNVTEVLHQLLVRYRRGAALHVGLSTSLGLGGVGLVVWRLWLNGVRHPVLGGVAAAGLLGVAAWQWRVLRRERLNRRQLVAQLDEALGLKARLLTAVEFADAPEPPALYARLLEETTSTLPEAFRRLPPVVDRRMVALAAVLLLLWLWPRSSTRLTQVAMSPPSMMPPPESPPPSPEQRQDRAASSQNQTGAQSNGSQDSRGSQTSQTSPSQSTRGSQPDARQAQQQSSAQANASSGSQDQKRQSAQQQASASASEQREQSGRAGQTGQASASASQDRDGAARESGAKQQMAKLSQAAGAQQAGSSAQQELLKADIQQLLKELSTELKQLQTELEAAQRQDHANPAPGTSTDPNLSGDSAQAKQAAGNRLPVQLEVDTQPTASTRRGGGVGKPSTEVADALPQQQLEEATLSDVRTTETGVAPQSIPPEYRPVFERLSRQ